MRAAPLLLLTFLLACSEAAPLRHAKVSLGVGKPVGDVYIEHNATRIAWTVADPSNVGGLWADSAPRKLIIPPGWEAGRALLLCAGVSVSHLNPGTEKAAVVIEKVVTSNIPLAIQQATATDQGYVDMSLCVTDAGPVPGDSYQVLVYAYDSAHGQRVQAYYPTFFQGQQLSE